MRRSGEAEGSWTTVHDWPQSNGPKVSMWPCGQLPYRVETVSRVPIEPFVLRKGEEASRRLIRHMIPVDAVGRFLLGESNVVMNAFTELLWAMFCFYLFLNQMDVVVSYALVLWHGVQCGLSRAANMLQIDSNHNERLSSDMQAPSPKRIKSKEHNWTHSRECCEVTEL